MNVKNSYPELPEIPYKRTSVEMPLVVSFAKTLLVENKYPKDSIRMAYAIFRNESANGKKGVSNNYGGIQGDVGRWTNLPYQPIATCVKVDCGGANRRFLYFDEAVGYKASFELFCIKSRDRNMVTSADYFKKWVSRKPTQIELNSFNSLLNSAIKIFP